MPWFKWTQRDHPNRRISDCGEDHWIYGRYVGDQKLIAWFPPSSTTTCSPRLRSRRTVAGVLPEVSLPLTFSASSSRGRYNLVKKAYVLRLPMLVLVVMILLLQGERMVLSWIPQYRRKDTIVLPRLLVAPRNIQTDWILQSAPVRQSPQSFVREPTICSCCRQGGGSPFRLTDSWFRSSSSIHWSPSLLSKSTTEDETIPATTTSPATSLEVAVPTTSSTVAERFHDDMRRVLLSRRQHNPMVESSDRTERRVRPVILDADVDGAERVLSMLRHLETIQVVTEESYGIVMQAFVERGRLRWKNGTSIICAADQLEDLLDRLLQRMSSESHVSINTYNLVLEAYAICATPRGERDYASRANDLLQQMHNTFGSTNIPVKSLVHVLHAYSWQQGNLQDDDCARMAYQLLQQIIQRQAFQDDPFSFMQCHVWVIEALSKARSPNGAQQATDLFHQMKVLNATLSGDHPARQLLDAETFSNVILAWSKSSQSGSAQKAQDLLMTLVDEYKKGSLPSGSEPPLIAFNSVISAWGRLGAFEKAEKVLYLMDQTETICTRLIADAVSFNSVLYAQLRNPDREQAVEKALELVSYMEDNCHDRPNIRPNSFTYSTLLKCLIQSRRSDLVELTEGTLQKIEYLWDKGDTSVTPNNRVFNMMINVYAKSSDRYASRRAIRILDRMRQSKLYAPDIITFTSVMECLSRSVDPSAPEQVEELMQEAMQLYEATQSKSLMPNLRTFTMAIQTMANCQGSVVKARALLSRLVELYESSQDVSLKPNEYPYNYVLNCAANALEQKTEAFQIAARTYQEMRLSKLVHPDSFTYAFWFKCCTNLLTEGELKRNCITYAFEECKMGGLVSVEVLRRLIQGCPRDMVMKLLEIPDSFDHTNYRRLQLSDLPSEWSRNAQRSKSES